MSLATRLHLTKLALALVEDECARATRKHGPMRSHHEAFAVLKEEVDELWADVMRDRHGDASREAIQVAAMAIRMLVDVATWEPCEIDGFKLGPSNKEIEQAAAAAEAEAARGRALDAEQTTHVLEEAVEALKLAADRIADLERRLTAVEAGARQGPRYTIEELVEGITPENVHGEFPEADAAYDPQYQERLHQPGHIPDELLTEDEAYERYLRETDPAEVARKREQSERFVKGLMTKIKAPRVEQADQISGREFRSSLAARDYPSADDILGRIRARVESKKAAEAEMAAPVVDTDEFLSDRGVPQHLRDQLTAWMDRKDAYAKAHGPNGVSRDERRAEIASRSAAMVDEILPDTHGEHQAEIDAIHGMAGIYPMTDPYDCVGKDDAFDDVPSYDLTGHVRDEVKRLDASIDTLASNIDEILPILNAVGVMHDATNLRIDRIEGRFDKLLDIREQLDGTADARGTLIENRLDKVEDGISGLDETVYEIGADLKQLIQATADLTQVVLKLHQWR